MVTSSTPSLPISDQPSSTNPLTASLNPLRIKFYINYVSTKDTMINQMPNFAMMLNCYGKVLPAKPLTKCPQDSRLAPPTTMNFSIWFLRNLFYMSQGLYNIFEMLLNKSCHGQKCNSCHLWLVSKTYSNSHFLSQEFRWFIKGPQYFRNTRNLHQ